MQIDATTKLLRDKLDYIDRTVQACPDTSGAGGEWGFDREAVRVVLDQIKQAEWIEVGYPDEENGEQFVIKFHECSACGKKVLFSFLKTPYCSQCGARMKGQEPGGEEK